MIGAYCHDGNVDEGWRFFNQMRGCGLVPTQFTYGSVFTCEVLDVERALCLQGVCVKSGMLCGGDDAYVGTALLGLFGRRGCVNEALWVFEEMCCKSVVTWNAMISLFGREGFGYECILMFCRLMRTGMRLSEGSFVGVLSGEDLESGEQVHGLVVKLGLVCKVAVANSLVSMYGKCAGTRVAEKMFKMVPNRDLVSWNTIIGVLAKGDEPVKGLEFFCRMCIDGFLPNHTTILSAITACSSLVNLYAKCEKLDCAHHCFDEILDKNLISWNALLLGYSNRGCSTSVSLLREMIQLGVSPNEFSFSSVIKSLLALELMEVHSLVIKMGYHSNEYVSSALMTSYAKNGLTADALSIFNDDKLPHSVIHSNVIAGMYNRSGQYHKTQELFCEVGDPDTVSWNILIAACSRNGDFKEAFELFHHMQMDRITPDNYTYVSLLSICTKLCNLVLGSSLHGLMMKANFNRSDLMVCNIMIDMYGKCGSLWNAATIFDEMIEKNVVSWTALVSALGLNGYEQEAVERFKQMEMIGIEPDNIAFIAVLSACRHAGLVNEGMELFEKMREKYGIEPQMEHYLLVVDLMSRYGHLKEAELLISGMPFPPNAGIWRSFLDGCNRQRTIEDLSLPIQAC
ncbi:Pentatricopeptide repeat-containing protein [Artemisia annua]|uniref:Pentatricopeptide repeat-containing protein n=1 Tax=Artemisia annua TaxID=35608 RepID=A0A2U1KD42_ARTAN|nr:Pentatricopeptide repeat-containing protein [Artemisia annua]